MHSGDKKRSSFVALLFVAGDLQRLHKRYEEGIRTLLQDLRVQKAK
jgi:hypothetical protein